MKRIILILTLAALTLSLLAACGEKKSDAVTSLAQLREPGRIIGVGIGTGDDAAVRETFPNAEIRYLEDSFMGYSGVASGKLDAFVYGKQQMELAIRNGTKGVKLLDDLTFTLRHDDKVAFVGGNEQAKTMFFRILMGLEEPDEGSFKWGVTTKRAYFPKDYTDEFDNDLTVAQWLTQYSEIKDQTYVRGFLGRMLFAGEDGDKYVKVLSGGEKVRCLFSKMMISAANVLIFDEPTNHLDMESITALNDGMIKFPGVMLFSSRDHEIVETTANRIMEILPNGKLIDKVTTYDEYLASDEMARKRTVYTSETDDED